jgi:hypothetical protein
MGYRDCTVATLRETLQPTTQKCPGPTRPGRSRDKHSEAHVPVVGSQETLQPTLQRGMKIAPVQKGRGDWRCSCGWRLPGRSVDELDANLVERKGAGDLSDRALG